MALVINCKRTATVKALTHCDLYSLSRRDLDMILIDHPEAAQQLKKTAEKSRYAFKRSDAASIRRRWDVFSEMVHHIKVSTEILD